MDEYEHHLKNLIAEIYDPAIPFKHDEDKDRCAYCQRLGMPSDFY
jgi:hypothetical protein